MAGTETWFMRGVRQIAECDEVGALPLHPGNEEWYDVTHRTSLLLGPTEEVIAHP